MSRLIAVTGKGGVGKTTVAALLVSELISAGRTPILAVDADPNSCLDAALGVKTAKTVGGVREEAREIAGRGLAVGAAKQELLEMKIAECLVESVDFDFIAMGRPEGPGCYCYANNVLRDVISTIAAQYLYVVVDNEAGLENLSRRIVRKVDVLVMVTDPSERGAQTIRRLHGLASEMGLDYAKLAVVVNRARGGTLPESVGGLAEELGAACAAVLPDDPEVALCGETGRPVHSIPPDNPVRVRLRQIVEAAG